MKLIYIELILITAMLLITLGYGLRARIAASDQCIAEGKKEYYSHRFIAAGIGGLSLILMFSLSHFYKADLFSFWEPSKETHIGATEKILPKGEYTVGPALGFIVNKYGDVEGSGNFYSHPFNFKTTLKYDSKGRYYIDDIVTVRQPTSGGKATFRLTIQEISAGNTYSSSTDSTDLVHVFFTNENSAHSVHKKEYLMHQIR